jgi:hypothetical protein
MSIQNLYFRNLLTHVFFRCLIGSAVETLVYLRITNLQCVSVSFEDLRQTNLQFQFESREADIELYLFQLTSEFKIRVVRATIAQNEDKNQRISSRSQHAARTE